MKKMVIGFILVGISTVSANAYEVLNSYGDGHLTKYTIKCDNGKINANLTAVGDAYTVYGREGLKGFNNLDAAAKYTCDE